MLTFWKVLISLYLSFMFIHTFLKWTGSKNNFHFWGRFFDTVLVGTVLVAFGYIMSQG